jgi:hypothetical protein
MIFPVTLVLHTVLALFAWSLPQFVKGLTGGCNCASARDQQDCLNKLVLLQQKGLTPNGQLCDTKDQACINAYVRTRDRASPKLYNDKVSCDTQACLNDIICFQYQFAGERFAYVGEVRQREFRLALGFTCSIDSILINLSCHLTYLTTLSVL